MGGSSKDLYNLKQQLAKAMETIETLSGANQKHAHILNHINDFIWVMNRQFDITWISPSVYSILGFTDTKRC